MCPIVGVEGHLVDTKPKDFQLADIMMDITSLAGRDAVEAAGAESGFMGFPKKA